MTFICHDLQKEKKNPLCASALSIHLVVKRPFINSISVFIARLLHLHPHCTYRALPSLVLFSLHSIACTIRTWRILLIKEKMNRRNTKRRHTKHTLSHWSHVSVSRFGKRAAMVSIASEYLRKKPKQYI